MVILIFLFFADSLFKEGDYFNAITEYKRILFLKQGDKKKLYYKIAKCYEKIKNLEKAIYYYSKYYYLEDEPSDTFLLRYSYLLFKIGKIEEGISLLKSVPENESVNFLISYGYLKLNNLKKYYNHLPDKRLYRNEKFYSYMSLIFPGIPIILNGHFTEGLTSLIMNILSGYLVYRDIKKENYLSLPISFSLFLRFYIGNYSATKNIIRKNNIENLERKIKIYLPQ